MNKSCCSGQGLTLPKACRQPCTPNCSDVHTCAVCHCAPCQCIANNCCAQFPLATPYVQNIKPNCCVPNTCGTPKCRRCGCSPCRCSQNLGSCNSKCGYLVERIIGTCQCNNACVSQEICLDCIPPNLAMPYCVTCIKTCAKAPWYDIVSKECNMLKTNVYIPVICTLVDANNAQFCVEAVIERAMCIPLCCAINECQKYKIDVQSCMRLLQNVCCVNRDCFCAQLDISIGVYVTVTCPIYQTQKNECQFDNRPLYPQPYNPCR